MLELLLSHLPSIISAVCGGGLVTAGIKAYQTYFTQRRKDDQQDHEQDLELSEHLESRLSKMEGRLDSAESELRTTREELSRARIREDELTAAVHALIDRVDRLLNRLEEHEHISEDERDRLTSVPPYARTSNDDTQSKPDDGSSSETE